MTTCHDRRVARVLDVIQNDLSKRLSRTQAARIANLEPAYFSKRFHQSVGLSFVEWNSQVRVTAAKRLLATIDLPIAFIASDLGYASITSFERAFRKHTGVSPREYRRALKTPFVSQDDTKAERKTRDAD